MTTLYTSYSPAQLFYDAVDTVPSSPDAASSDSVGSPLEGIDFPYMNDLQYQIAQQNACFDMASLDYLNCAPFEPDMYYVEPADSFCPPIKAEPTVLPALQQGVLASLEALKATDPEKGYHTAKQHTPVKKMKANVARVPVEEDRIIRRRTKNREAAQASRQRKRMRLETLEAMVAEQKAITAAIMTERDTMHRENATLRSELAYLKEALRSSVEGLRGLESDPMLFAQELNL